MTTRVAVIATHPIQYYAPLYRELSKHIDLTVLYGHQLTPEDQGGDFGVPFRWDTPILEGYKYKFLANHAKRPNVSLFWGIDAPGIAEEISPNRFDVVVLHGWGSRLYFQALRAARRAGVPTLVRGDSQLPTTRPLWVRALKWFPYRGLMRRFDGFLFVGQRSKEYLEYYGVPESRLFFSPHCVDNQFFAEAAARLRPLKRTLRQQYGINTDGPVFLFAGKLVDHKRPWDFVHAIERARNEGAGLYGFLVGDGSLRHDLQDYASDHQLPLIFAGFMNQTEIPRAYAVSDVLVLPSNEHETWGLVVNEAMANGIPAIVSTAVGCGPDLVKTGRTGATFHLGDVEQLASLMRGFCERPNDLAEMGKKCMDVIRNYSVQKAAAGVVQAADAVSVVWVGLLR